MRTYIIANAANRAIAWIYMLDMLVSASCTDVIQLADPRMHYELSATRTSLAVFHHTGINECMRDARATRCADVVFRTDSGRCVCMCTLIPASLAHSVFEFMAEHDVADLAFSATELFSDNFQFMRKLQIADLARVFFIPAAAEPLRMAALSRRAADSALTRIARIILMPLMLLVTLLAKSRMISGPAMLMRPGEQSQFIRFHCAPPQNGVLLPDGTRQMTELFSGFGLLLASTSSRLKFS